MKKVVSFILVLMLISSAASMDTYAMNKKWMPSGLAQKGFLPPGIAKKFKDIDGYDWAERAIEKMAIKGVIKGYGEGRFAPKNPVTKLESIIMALRVMGYEDEARLSYEKVKKGKKELKYKERIQEWAYGYISVALEKGLLDEYELLDFKLTEPAKRHEVAKYIIRALGYEEEAQEHMKEELRFIDAEAIPLGSVGYVYLSDKKGIIQGYPDDTFRPNRPVTRAEMAVLIARLDDKVDSDIDEREEYAEVVGVSEDRLTIKIGNEIKRYDVLENVPVYNDEGEYVSIDELDAGMKVELQLNEDGTVIFIEIKESKDDKIVYNYEGEVVDIEDDNITVKMNHVKITFEVSEDTEVVFEDDEEGSLDDIEIDDEVEIIINDDEVEYIKVDRELEQRTYEGTVADIDDDILTINMSKTTVTFEVYSDFEVSFNDEEGEVEDLRIGDKVKVIVDEDNEVKEIIAERDIDSDVISGELADIYEDSEQIVVKNGTEYKIYKLDDDAKVYLNNERTSLSKLEINDNLRLKLDDDKVIEIKAYRLIIED